MSTMTSRVSVPDHPEIQWLQRTGYPSWAQPEDFICERCGEVIEGEIYEDECYEYLCEGCLLYTHMKG